MTEHQPAAHLLWRCRFCERTMRYDERDDVRCPVCRRPRVVIDRADRRNPDPRRVTPARGRQRPL